MKDMAHPCLFQLAFIGVRNDAAHHYREVAKARL